MAIPKYIIIFLLLLPIISLSVFSIDFPLYKELSSSDFSTEVMIIPLGDGGLNDTSDSGDVTEIFEYGSDGLSIIPVKVQANLSTGDMFYRNTSEQTWAESTGNLSDMQLCQNGDCGFGFWKDNSTTLGSVVQLYNADESVGFGLENGGAGNNDMLSFWVYNDTEGFECPFSTMPNDISHYFFMLSNESDTIDLYVNGTLAESKDPGSDCNLWGTETNFVDILNSADYTESASMYLGPWTGGIGNHLILDDFVVLDGLTDGITFLFEAAPSLECAPTVDQDWVLTGEETCDAESIDIGTGRIIIENGGFLRLSGNSVVRASGLILGGTGDLGAVETGSELIIE